MGHTDHAQVNALPAQAYLQDVMPAKQQRGCRCQRPHESAVLPHFLVLPIINPPGSLLYQFNHSATDSHARSA